MSEFTRYYEATIHAECHKRIAELEGQLAEAKEDTARKEGTKR